MASSSTTPPPPPPGSWIPSFLSRYSNPAPPIPSPSSSTPSNAAIPAPRDPNAPAPNSIYTSRGRKQASVFLAGVVSVVWAGSMTRRSLRKRKMPVPAAVLQEAAPATTASQAVQAARQAGQQAAPVPAARAIPVVEGLQGVKKPTGVMAETLQAYRGSVQQTSPGTSIGASEVAAKSVSEGAAKPASEALAHSSSPVGAAGATSAEDAAAAQAAAELNASGPILAMEALFLATANVLAWALLVTGGALWYADISSVEEMRKAVRGGLGVDGTGRSEQEAEEEMEEWLARVLKRGDERGGDAKTNERGRVR